MTVLQALKEFLGGGSTARDAPQVSMELAAAVLMLEVGLADSDLDEEEFRLMERAMQQHFRLDQAAADELIRAAREEVDHATSLYRFTRHLNETLSARQKSGIVELLWRVAYADAVVDKYEEYYIRKIADLLYVPHRDYILARHRAAGSAAD